MHTFPYQKVVLGISGGIAAYKSAELLRLLIKQGAQVRVVMTRSAQAFITPMTLQALSGHPVHSDLFDEAAEAAMGHIELAKWADVILIAPATANTLAKITHGLADDLLSTLCLATIAPIVVAPAMNQAMWHNAQTQHNIARCKELKIQILGPGIGDQACGDTGSGRMLEPEEIITALLNNISSTHKNSIQILKNNHIVITAGPTREAIDPVRFLSNHSSGKMGFALAQAAAAHGAQVTLVTGPVHLETPLGVTRINVETALQMHTQAYALNCDIFIGCAAVADYRPEHKHEQKIKKSAGDMQITFVRNPDILADISQRQPRPFCVGFAAETQALQEHAYKKLKKKSLDMIIANDVSEKSIGFNSNDNQVSVFWEHAEQLERQDFTRMNKAQLAIELINLIATLYQTKNS